MTLSERLRDHIERRDGPKLNGAWQMMLEAADLIDKQEAEIERLEDPALCSNSTKPAGGR